jgi:hypothetical protein
LARLNADGISAGDRHLWCCRPPKRKSAEASAADLASVFSDRADEETLVIKRGMESGIASVPSTGSVVANGHRMIKAKALYRDAAGGHWHMDVDVLRVELR